MAATTPGATPARTPVAPVLTGRTRITPISRIYGFGSIYGKTIRDSRLAFIIAAGLLGGLALFMGAAIGQVFPNPQSRLEIDKLPGVSDLVREDRTLRMRVSGPITPIVQAAAKYELVDFVSREPSLEETFLAQYGHGADGPAATPAETAPAEVK